SEKAAPQVHRPGRGRLAAGGDRTRLRLLQSPANRAAEGGGRRDFLSDESARRRARQPRAHGRFVGQRAGRRPGGALPGATAPEPGNRYGPASGPLAPFPRPHPADDRHKWEKATDAASHYIKDIYSTDAQASGLLVMASYNWGEQRVINMIRTLPQNPRERNFWKLLDRYREKIPNETYNYVLSIVAAAVIGENPRLFGFAFDN